MGKERVDIFFQAEQLGRRTSVSGTLVCMEAENRNLKKSTYIDRMIELFRTAMAKNALVSVMESFNDLFLKGVGSGAQRSEEIHRLFTSLTAIQINLSAHTLLDIVHLVGVLNRFLENLCAVQWMAAKLVV